MGLFDEEDEESNDDFMKRLNTQLDSQGPEIDPDSDPLPIEQIVAPPQQDVAPTVGKPFSLPASDIVRPSPQDLVKQRIDDLVKQRAAEKEQRGKLNQDVQDADSSILKNIFAGIAGFGAGVAGRDVGSAFKLAKDIGSAKSRNALAAFDKEVEEGRRGRADESEVRAEGRLMKRDEREDATYNAQRAAALREQDPNSLESQHAREYFKRLAPGTDPKLLSRLTAAQVKTLSPNYEKMADREYKTKEFQQKVQQHEADQKQRRDLHAAGQSGADRRNAASNASRERAAAIGAGAKAYESGKLPVTALEKLGEQRDKINQTSDLANQLNENYFGRFAGRTPNDFKGEERAAYEAALNTYTSELRHAIAGSSLTEPEREDAAKNYPQLTDPVDVAKGKIKKIQSLLTNKYNTQLDTFSRGGYPSAESQRLTNPAPAYENPTTKSKEPVGSEKWLDEQKPGTVFQGHVKNESGGWDPQ